MANPGVGTKFISVNLNKSYGQQSHPSNQGTSYGSNRARPVSHGGGGMVVLSRPRSSQKVGSKLSVPPPLNLPSMKKEHERFDSSGSGNGGTGGGASGTGSRPNSSGMGWTKPRSIDIQEKDETQADSIGVVDRGNNLYTPPVGRSGALSGSVSAKAYSPVDKAMVLRGEDFPSLGATLIANSELSQKQKGVFNSKQKPLMADDASNKKPDNSNFNPTRPHVQSPYHNFSSENSNGGYGLGISDLPEKSRKQGDYSSVPLPLIRLNPRSDWEDDERDTGHGITDQSRDYNVQKKVGYHWDRELDSQVFKVDSYGKDLKTGRDSRTPSRECLEGISWRNNFATKNGINNAQETGNYRNGVGPRSSIINREISNDTGYAQAGRQNWNNGVEQNTRDRYNGEQYSRYRGNNNLQSNSVSKSLINLSGKLNSEKPYVEDLLLKDFGGTGFHDRDPFTGAPIGVVKRKKDAVKQTDFHDPVRESFEAELERIQEMQEKERQRFAEEQERAIDLARREEEERERFAREEEERHRRHLEEAREAAFRAEQERVDAIRRSEEQRIAREEEKRRIAMEEERRKQAAKQKLLELEEKMSRRNAEATIVADNKIADTEKDIEQSKASEMCSWEDGERMVERITTSASSDSSSFSRSYEVNSRPQVFTFTDRVKPFSSWRRDVFENDHNSNIFLQEPRMDLEFQQDLSEKFGDIGWGQNRHRESPYQNQEVDGFYSMGRSRFSMKQPRVFPPPSLGASVNNPSSYRKDREFDRPDSSELFHREIGGRPRENLQLSELIDIKHEEPEIEIEEQKINNTVTLRCDSQSSLSVSNPPSSPNPLSHDDLDESRDPQLLSTSEGKENLILGSSSISHGDDDEEEWTVENDERLQEQEVYDEVEDGYQEEDEVHEGDDDNIDLTHEFEDMNLEEKSNVVLGFNEGVKVEMPSDEFEKSSMNEERAFSLPHVVQHTDVSSTSCSPFTQHLDTSASSPALNFSVAPTVMSSVPVVQSRPELQVKLQFGLFSTPSLIPSPFPAIQIGSIQMPLHLNPQVGPPLSHVHQSQPPLFQFGQFRFPSPTSQGLIPSGPSSMPCVQPNYSAQFSLNQNFESPSPIPTGQDTSSNTEKNVEGSTPVHHGPSDNNEANDISRMSKVDIQTKPRTVSNNYASLPNQSKAPGPVSGGGRGKKFVFSAKSTGSRLPFVGPEASRLESSSGFQRTHRNYTPRTEFRIRENADRRQSSGMYNSNFKERSTEPPVRNGPKRSSVSVRASNQTLAPRSFNSGPIQDIDFGSRVEMNNEKETLTKSQGNLRSGEGSLQRNIEVDNDEPLGSGVVHVYEQPGIEAPSDDDDFIEVRSKRQMLNDRREQREKEIKAKSRLTKAPRKQRSPTVVGSNKISASTRGESLNSTLPDYIISKGRSLVNAKITSFNTTAVPQPLAPIGTPSVNNEAHALKPIQTSSHPVISGSEKNHGSGSVFDTHSSKVYDNVQTSLGSWGNARIDQQVMDFTQKQLDEAMRPLRFDSHVASLGDHASTFSELISMPSTSTLAKEKHFTSSASPVNSLLAGEKIQFGAVTSPTILPPSSRAMPHGIGPSVESGRSSLFFEKEKHATNDEISQAEAAVAAITNDEIVESPTGSDVKSFGGADIMIPPGRVNTKQFPSQSRAEEPSLSVTLPADLSVETPPMSMWAPSQAQQNPTPQSLPTFHAGPTPHFPYFDTSPMLPPPIFAYGGTHDESSGSQLQSQTQTGNNITWPQSHSNADSFYGPPAGYTGPFISSPGGLPGVQGGPPHLFVYNHFAPVGRFGQVGMSFMGTYVPSGKQPDWKHNPNPSSANMGIAEGDMNNMNMPNHNNLPTPIQHLAHGSPLTVFDVSPYQSSSHDMSVPPQWSHVPSAPLQSAPMPVAPPQFNHESLMDPPNTVNSNRIPMSRSSTPSETNFVNSSEVSGAQFPDDLGLTNQSNPSISNAPTKTITPKKYTDGVASDSSKTGVFSEGSTGFKPQSSQQKKFSTSRSQTQQQKYYTRGGLSQDNKNNDAEWSQRRVGFQQRNHSVGRGAEKGFHSSKVKQIYVPKQPTSGTSSTTS